MSEERFVLFSPIGGTDPISKDKYNIYTDGSMLHICRKYKPEYIILYLSGEMLEDHQKDDRYRFCIQRLAEEIGFSPKIEIIERPELKEVQVFDTFYEEFFPLVNQIHDRFSGYTLIFNISSGTPAMKSSLYLLAAFLPYTVLPVQVDTPVKEQNRNQKEDYDNNRYWDNNLDRKEGQKSRCNPVEYRNLNVQLRMQDIKAHLKHYDYKACLTVASNLQGLINPYAVKLMQAADSRIKLNWHPGKELGLVSNNAGEGKTNLAEYLLWLQMKQKRVDLADFLRGLTPALFYLMKIAVEEKLGYPLSTAYCSNRDGTPLLQPTIMEQDEMGSKLLKIIEAEKNIGGRRNKVVRESEPLKSSHYTAIIKVEGKKQSWAEPLLKLRSIEEAVRNPLAHQITQADEKGILVAQNAWRKNPKKNSGLGSLTVALNSVQVMDLIKNAVRTLNADKRGKGPLIVNWQAYEEMNEKIVAALLEGTKK